MTSLPTNRVGRSQQRSFGLIVGAGFVVIGLWPTVFSAQPPRRWALVLSLVLAVTALVAPAALKPFHRVWMVVGESLGWVNSRIILGAVYCVLVVPIGLIRRLSGHDPMRRKLEGDATTYKSPRAVRPASHMRRQY